MTLAHSMDRLCPAGIDEDMQPEVSQPASLTPPSFRSMSKTLPSYLSSRQDRLTLAAQDSIKNLESQLDQSVSGLGSKKIPKMITQTYQQAQQDVGPPLLSLLPAHFSCIVTFTVTCLKFLIKLSPRNYSI